MSLEYTEADLAKMRQQIGRMLWEPGFAVRGITRTEAIEEKLQRYVALELTPDYLEQVADQREAHLRRMGVDFDVQGAEWVETSTAGSKYHEQLDASRVHGHYRHRLRGFNADDPHGPWCKGPAPDTAEPN